MINSSINKLTNYHKTAYTAKSWSIWFICKLGSQACQISMNVWVSIYWNWLACIHGNETICSLQLCAYVAGFGKPVTCLLLSGKYVTMTMFFIFGIFHIILWNVHTCNCKSLLFLFQLFEYSALKQQYCVIVIIN